MACMIKIGLLYVLLCFFQQTQSQDIAGDWTGVLAHKSCLTIRYGFTTKLILRQEGSAWSGTIQYFGSSTAIGDTTIPVFFGFSFTARMNKNQLQIHYSAKDELQGRGTYGTYEAYGDYTIVLSYSKNDATGKERLTGFYGGSNGSRGEIYLQRTADVLAARAADSSGSILNRLRSRIAERKKTLPDTSIAALLPPPGTAMPDTSGLFGSLLPAPAADSALLQTISKSNSRKLDSSTILALERASYVDIQIYDNAVEDGDTISILADSQLLAHRIHVGTKPTTIRLVKPFNRSTTRIVMVAENLGSIPPNTAYLVFEADDKTRYTINLSSSYTQSGSIVLKWK
jgi:hypothetical protein